MKMTRQRSESEARNLYLLATSDNPDPYVNVLVHRIEREQPDRVTFVKISGKNQADEGAKEELQSLQTRVENRLGELAKGFYPRQVDGRVEHHQIGEQDAARYERTLKNLRDRAFPRPIAWADLDKELGEIVAEEGVIIDVTTLRKDLLADVVAILTSRGFLNFYTFDLGQAPEHFDDRALIHSLGDYEYRRIGESCHIRAAKKRMVARSVTFKFMVSASIVVGIVTVALNVAYAGTMVVNVLSGIGVATGVAGIVNTLKRSNG